MVDRRREPVRQARRRDRGHWLGLQIRGNIDGCRRKDGDVGEQSRDGVVGIADVDRLEPAGTLRHGCAKRLQRERESLHPESDSDEQGDRPAPRSPPPDTPPGAATDHVTENSTRALRCQLKDGAITVEETKGTETNREAVEGMRFNRCYLSPYFVTKSD